MPSHLSSIGLPVASQDDLSALVERVAPDAHVFGTAAGRYLRWSSPSGAELWLHVDRDHDLVSMHPHFRGASTLPVRLTARVAHPDDSPLEGAFHAWAAPGGSDVQGGAYPLVFALPDFQCYPDFDLPVTATAQVAAFAHEACMFATAEAYRDAQDDGEVTFASQSFVPTGLFAAGDEAPSAPEPFAFFTGHVTESAEAVNELTGASFYWALVETLGGTFDVVLDPGLLSDVPPTGGVLQGSFWLSGRLTDYPQSRTEPFARRLSPN